ncbi:hypothetical protein [Photobacterium toruni]|uniref:Uncharacterized protein n=1 Tax=Photobacterium toruni TaxID=1935446 RepID=A0A1T4UJH0_9GAMM|nr:hypothetical protein [Photobacterium toruni]SKA52718.1 hypothetical protein CZ814_03334 [Photobacterium toruni]
MKIIKGATYSSCFEDEAKKGVAFQTRESSLFSPSTLQDAISSVRGKIFQSMTVPNSCLGSNANSGSVEEVYAELMLAKRIFKSEDFWQRTSVACNPSLDSRFSFSVDDLKKSQMDIALLTEEAFKAEAARFICWLFECLKGVGCTSVEIAQERGYQLIILDGQQTLLKPWERPVERLVVVLSPSGEKVAERVISPKALGLLDSVFEEVVSAFKGQRATGANQE